MKRSNQNFVLFLVFLLAFVLPVAVLAGKDDKGGDEQKAQHTIFTDQINEQTKVLIQDINALTDGLEEAEFRLAQFETEYEAVLTLGDPVEIERLSAEIATEESNITVMAQMKKTVVEEMHKVTK